MYRLPGIVCGERYRRLPNRDHRGVLAQGVDDIVRNGAMSECQIGIRRRARLRLLGMYGIIFH